MFYFQEKKKFQLKSKKKKKIVTEQNNEWQAKHQAHGKPNKLQRKQTYRFSQKKKKKKKKKNPNIEQITKSETSNQYIRNH